MKHWGMTALLVALCLIPIGFVVGRATAPNKPPVPSIEASPACDEVRPASDIGLDWPSTCREMRVADSSWAMAFSDDSRLLAAGTGGADGGGVEVFDVASGERRFERSTSAKVHFVCFLDDGMTLVTAEGDRTTTLRRWDRTTGDELDGWRPELPGAYAQKALAVSPDGRLAVVAHWLSSGDHRLSVLDLQGRHAIAELPPLTWTGMATMPRQGAFSPDGRYFVASSYILTESGSGQYMLFDVPSWAVVRSVYTPYRPEQFVVDVTYESEACPDENEAWDASFSHNGQRIAVGLARGAVVRDSATGDRLHHFDEYCEPAALSPNGRLLAASFPPGVVSGVALHDLASDTLLAWRIPLPPREGRVTALAFSPDGKTLAIAWGLGLIRLWELDFPFVPAAGPA